jgi:quercetin dioxygenase-like cupin family protein
MSASEATATRSNGFGRGSPGRKAVVVILSAAFAVLIAAFATERADNGSASVMSGTVLQSSAASRPRPAVHPVASDALPHVAGKRITTVVVEFPPAGISPAHHHGGSVTVYVLSGVIRSQLQGQPPIVYKAGDSFFEPPGIVHLLAENVSATEPARILAVFVADEGATLTTYHE